MQYKLLLNLIKEGLRKLNHALLGAEIITCSDLVKKGEAFVEPCVSMCEYKKYINIMLILKW